MRGSGIRELARRRRRHLWQIIYMDLMTIVMVFFVILWSLDQGSDVGISQTIGDQTLRTVSLPGDVLFASGRHDLTSEGEEVFGRLFSDDSGAVLSFDTGGVARRQLVIHGHTDSDGKKDENLRLGFQRAFAVYKEIEKYGPDFGDHVIVCSHADNSPVEEVPPIVADASVELVEAAREAKAKNRRITIEDRLVSTLAGE